MQDYIPLDKHYRVYAADNFLSGGVDFHICKPAEPGQRVDVSVTFTETVVDETFCVAAPSLSVTRQLCQQILDELWRLGYRPDGGKGTEAERSALHSHLRDMRAIVFSKLQVEDPTK